MKFSYATNNHQNSTFPPQIVMMTNWPKTDLFLKELMHQITNDVIDCFHGFYSLFHLLCSNYASFLFK